MAEKSIENHKIVIKEHEMRTGGHYLAEKKHKTVIKPEMGNPEVITTIIVHSRIIDQKQVVATEVMKGDGKPERTLEHEGMTSEAEKADFEDEWERLWKPKLTETQIAKLQ